MRKDGSITYYTIVAKYINRDEHDAYYQKWFQHIDATTCIDWNPETKRYRDSYNEKTSYLGQYFKSNRDNPNCGGYVWQNYGPYGVTNLPAAEKWLNILLPYHQWALDKSSKENGRKTREQKVYKKKMECEFRIVKITKTQKTEFV